MKTVEILLVEQIAYYRAMADEYDAVADAYEVDAPANAELRRNLVDGFRPVGDVLELACGTGRWTQELIRHARSVTAVDASPEMLAINQRRLDDARVRYFHADIFGWQPDRIYDVVFFAFWLSHVPPQRFAEFWNVVASCVNDTGRVVFVDEDNRSRLDDPFQIGATPCARRALRDGREFEIVKMFWRAEDLEARLQALGWEIKVRRVGEMFLVGSGRRTPPGNRRREGPRGD